MTGRAGSEDDLDARLVAALDRLAREPPDPGEGSSLREPVRGLLPACYLAQLRSRHLDLAARRLRRDGEGFHTIGSAGHESNAAVALAVRPTDPALLHYRSGAFYCARAAQVTGSTPVRDVLAGILADTRDPASGGRHKVIGNPALHVIPQTSTVASHLPRAVGLAFALGRARRLRRSTPWPPDALVVASLGDASVNHSTAVGALNAAAHAAYQRVPVPLLVVCEDNGLGISVPTPAGWVEATLGRLPGIGYLVADGDDPAGVLRVAAEASNLVRRQRRPVVLHLRTVRLFGHAGSDAELAYRTPAEIAADHERDPVLATARLLMACGLRTADRVREEYQRVAEEVLREEAALLPARRLATAEEVMAPLRPSRPREARAAALATAPDRRAVFAGRLPEEAGPLTLAQSLTAALTDLMAAHPQMLVLGEDVAVKGGVYGVTRGLRARFGAGRVFDTPLDEQTILGTALGAALAGFLPVPEIQYLAYLHNAEDQLRGEAATLAFLSDGRYRNGLVVRIAGLAHPGGFGGHFHNDTALGVLRDVPGLVLAVPSGPAEAPGLLRALAGLALAEGRVCVLVEPIALYHQPDLVPGDGAWRTPYPPPERWDETTPRLGEVVCHRAGADVLAVTFGNGVPITLRAADSVAGRGGPQATVLDLRWLAPLPVAELLRVAQRFPRVLVVDETRRTGGVSEAVVTALVDGGYGGRIARVAAHDSLVPLGPAADLVLLSQTAVEAGLWGPGTMAP